MMATKAMDGLPILGFLSFIIQGTPLRDLNIAEAPCLIANQDEGFTYNQKVNRIAPVSSHLGAAP